VCVETLRSGATPRVASAGAATVRGEIIGRGRRLEQGGGLPTSDRLNLGRSEHHPLESPFSPFPTAHAEAIERALAEGGVRLEQVHHGDGIASWAVNRRAVARGHGIRTGLEDTTVLPDGRVASGNGELVVAAAMLLAQSR
jgi:hypothetical protein